MSIVDIAIVGYGTVGATLANFLGQAGVTTVVYERSEELYPLPRACHLDAETMRIFQAAGLANEVSKVVEPSYGMEFVDADGKRIFTYEDFQRAPILGWEEDYVFQQPLLDEVIRKGVERFPSITVHFGSEICDPEEIDAQFVVACDGASSSIRRSCGIDLDDWGYDEEWLVIDLVTDRDLRLPNIIQQVCNPERPTTYVPSAGGHHRWELRVLKGENSEELCQPEKVSELLESWVEIKPGELVRSAVYRFHAVIASQWRHNNVFLAGDAAHQMPPFMGQGLCSGIRDAANLAWKLIAVLSTGAPEDLLETYELERRPHVKRCIELSIEAGKLLTSSTPSFPEADVDDDEQWSRLPPIAEGVLNISKDGFRVGHQARQPTVIFRGQNFKLDDLGGSWWYLLARGQVTESPFPVLNFRDLEDPDGWLDRLLGENWAVMIRPDRYIFGFAPTQKDVPNLILEAQSWVGPNSEFN